MREALWIALVVLLVVLVWLQFRGVTALRDWGVAPSRAVITLRAVNTVAVIALVIFAYLKWVS